VEAVPVEMESFYTFAWAPRPRTERGPRREPREGGGEGHRGPREARGGDHKGGDRPHKGGDRGGDRGGDHKGGEKRHEGGKPRHRDEDGPRGERKFGGEGGKGGPKGGKPWGKGKPQDDRGRGFESHPPKKDKPIDPDNPFAAALMGLKGKL
jgi:ATP-dependent RNA helicase SUPV3L1/SUV3